MRKYNDELLAQVVSSKWNTDGINAEVEIAYKPFFQLLTFRTIHKKKTALDYNELAEEAITQLKEQLNDRLQGSKKITVSPWGDNMVFAKFDGDRDGRFWGDVFITIRLKVCYSPIEERELVLTDYDIDVINRYQSIDNG